MSSNQKKFGIFVFLSTFSRNLIEVFIPVILYKYGYSIREVLFYYLMANVFSLLISYPAVYFSKKFNNKLLSLIGIIGFVILQILLNYMTYSIYYLLLIAMLYAIYRRGYWISRRYYTLKVIEKEHISSTYSLISIINQIGVIISAYMGSLILDFINLKVLTLIAIILFLMSIIPLHYLKFKHKVEDEKLNVLENMKNIPKSNLYLFGSYELINVVKFLIPLYLFIYVQNRYQIIGIVNLVSNFALITFTFLFGKKLDNSMRNYLRLAIVLTVITYIFKINSFGYILLLVSFAEGIVLKMHELSISKEFYTLSKNFEYYNYNLIYEIIQNAFRSIVVLILFIFNFNLKTMVYITLIFILIGAFLKFKQKKPIEDK